MNADAAHPNPELARRLERIYDLHGQIIDLRLKGSPYLDLLEKLGNPHKRMPPVVHVAGTNGKGSTLAFVRAICEAAGYRAHVYTSPHLAVFNERIRLAGRLVSDAALMAAYDDVLAANAGAAVSFFEFTTALAFHAFAQTPADVLLLETGVGGRLDCTNVIEKPACTIITKISFDHMHLLGDTLAAIAGEKAGIMKAAVPCVIAPQMDEAAVMPVFEKKAAEVNAPLVKVRVPETLPPLGLAGAHQRENAAAALSAADCLEAAGFVLPAAQRREGLARAVWPGRMQPIAQGPVAALLPAGWDLWYDAAHNDSGAMALAAELRRWKEEAPSRAVHLVVGLGHNKDTRAFFGPLQGLYDSLTLVDLHAMAPQSAAELKDRAGLSGAAMAATVGRALEALACKAKADKASGMPPSRARVCVAGSLYLYQDVYPDFYKSF